MTAERARLLRLQRLERVRAIAKQAAARDSAEAESTLAQLETIAARTRRLAADYAARGESLDGGALQQLARFAGALQGISASTSGDAARARLIADAKLGTLAAAERSRAAVGTRADRQARVVAASVILPVLGGRKALGTGLE